MITPRTTPGLVLALGAGLLLAAGCTGPDRDPTPASPGELTLVAFDSCDQARQQLRAAARGYVGPWGFELPGGGADGQASAAVPPGQADAAQEAAGGFAAPEADRGAVPEAGPAEPAAPDHSGTNVHESGVDEPDLVKTDGRRIVTVHDGMLRVIDAARRVETGKLALVDPVPEGGWWPQPVDLLLAEDRALVLLRQSSWGGGPEPAADPATRPGAGAPPLVPGAPRPTEPDAILGPTLVLVDLTGPPRVIGSYAVDGGLLDARAVGSRVRVVVHSRPRLDFPAATGQWDEDQQDEAQRIAANRAVVEAAELADWLPRYESTVGGRTESGQVPCTAVTRPERYSGTSMLTVLTFDLAAPALGTGDPVTILADGDTVYSNGTSLYVAGGLVADRTDIYKFDTSQPGAPRYAAAGSVTGWLLNQYALSEWDGHLRIATTTAAWQGGEESESTVYVLAQDGEELVAVGSVGGLGKTERIYSVRFIGPVGYVVTFRETDPLYTLDLSNPAAPAVLGELKISGYSAYLHPISGQELIGVGQEADQQGRVQGTQVSLFDVSDLADPTLRAKHHIWSGHSEAEADPHAFLWWPAERLLVLPVQVVASGQAPTGAVLLRVGPDGFTQVGEISHPQPAGDPYSSAIRRSLVVGDTLWTVSGSGVQANALATFESVAWLPFD